MSTLEHAPAELPAPVAIDVTFRVRRFNPELDAEPHWEDYVVPCYPTDRILDGLAKIKADVDGTLSYRRSCAHGICGSDAMRINGRNRLACKTLVKDLDISKPITVEAIKGLHPHPMDKTLIPGCTYCHPQVASVGLTEKAAQDKKIDIRVGRFPFIGNGKAVALGEDQGLVKVIFDKKTGQLLGAHMIGAEVTELIQGYVVAMNLETTEAELIHTVFPHPTLSEMMHESVLAAYGKVIHI